MVTDRSEESSSPSPEVTTNGSTQSTEVVNLLAKLQTGELTHDEQLRLIQVIPVSSVVTTAFHDEVHDGPLPPADELNRYDDLAKRIILQMAQDEQKSEHALRMEGLRGAINKDRRGQMVGGAIAITGLIVAAVIAPHSAVAAAIIGTLDLFGMVALFVAPRILERRWQDNNRQD